MEMPVIKAYTKTDICYLLRNPNTDLQTRKCSISNTPVVPLKLHSLKQNLIKHLEQLNIPSDQEYNAIRIFSPSQVRYIFETLL